MSVPSAGFLTLALKRSVVNRALKVSLLVGSILALINHGDVILGLALDGNVIFKILLTYLVPYGVSTYASVRAIQAEKADA